MSSNRKWILSILMAAVVGWTQVGCMMPEEGTIIYDQDYPEIPNENVGGSGGDGGGDSSGTGGGTGDPDPESNAGFTVAETEGGTSVTESSDNDTISIVLDEEPTADVTISLVTVPSDQISSSPSSLTFTPGNWDEPQVVTVSAIEDGDLDGDVTSTLSVLVSGSEDPNYASGIEAQDISVTTIDSGTIILPPPPASGPGITVTQTDGNTVVEESGATDLVYLQLNEEPTGDVTVAITSPDGEINASPDTVTFTPTTWDQPQYVTISAVEDGVADNDQGTNFTVAVSDSNDPNYSSELGTIRVPVSVIDSGNVSGIVITSSGGNNQLNENGDGDSFTVALSMKPSAEVTITLSDNDSSEISYNPTTLTFTPENDNWKTPQTVVLSAPEDNIKDGNQTSLLTLTSTSDDAASNGLSTSTEVVTVDSQTEPGVTITDAPLSLMEGGDSQTLSIGLDTSPAAGTVVTITLSDNDSSEISYEPAVLTFTSSNWNTPQTVEVNAVEDGIKDGNQQVSLSISVSSTPAGSYGSTMDTSLTITTQDSGNTPPDSPTGFVATPTTPSGSIDLSWTEPSNPAADNYTIYWTDDPNTPIDPSKPSTYSGSLLVTAPATTETITGLDPANDYDFTIIATNSLGDSTPAAEDDARPIPEAPTGLTASAGAASGQVDLEWNPSPGADSYTIYYSNDGGNTFTAISPNVTGTSYPHTGLNDGTEYTYYVVANNTGGASESSDTISATPGVEPPSAPSNLTATAGSGEVTLNWTAVDGAEDYTIYVSTSGSNYTAISPNVTGTSFTHTNLTNGTNYSYYVVANNAGGASANSNVVNATPKAPTVDPPAAVTGFNVIRGVQAEQPTYLMMWDSHPDVEENCWMSSCTPVDYYYVYVSDDMATPIDRTDSSTWDFEIDLQESGSEDFYTNTDSDFPWVEGTQYHFAIYFYDVSRGEYSPKAVPTDPVVVPASLANQTVDNVTVIQGFITNDNQSIFDWDPVGNNVPRIRYNEPIQSGERVIFDGQVFYDEVINFYETMGWGDPSDCVYLRLMNADNVTDEGDRLAQSSWVSLTVTNNIALNESYLNLSGGSSNCGNTYENTDIRHNFDPNTVAQNYDLAWEISSSNSAGRILHNGTLNGATDYSVEAGGNSYTKSYVDTNLSGYSYNYNSSNWDSSISDEAYVELRLKHDSLGYTGDWNDSKTFNIKNISAGFSKVAIPITPPTNLAGTTPANTQQVNLTWTKSTDPLVANHVIYWKKASGSLIVIDPDDSTTYDGKITLASTENSYTHSGLDGSTQYNYVIRAEANVGGVSTSEPSVNSYAKTTNSFDEGGPINPDPDEDLLVYYQFNGDLTDTAQYHGDNRYDLTAVSGANIVFADSQFSNNTAAYFDASNGYAYNNSLNDTNEADLFSSGGFTISLWFYADEDMKQFSSLMSSRYVPETGNDGGIQSWQLDSNKNQGLRWRSQAGEDKSTRVHTSTGNTYPTNQWSHATFVKQADGTSLVYMNGVLEVTSSESQPTPMYALKIGTNRREEHPWKGYIDEFKIYKRALTAEEVNNLYINDTPSTDGTSWNQGVDFNGSSGYARNSNNWNGQNPLHRLTSITPSNSVSSGQTAASGQPWAVAAVFKPTDLSTSRTLWSQSKMESDSRHNDSVKIEIDTNGRIFFNYGDNYNALQWRSANSLITAGNWYGLYVDFNGGSTGVSSGDINRYYSRFQFKLVNLSNGSVTDITSGGSWSHVNSSYGTTQDVGGYFYVGSYVTNTANRFKGQIASTVVTTLRTGQSLPDDTEVAMIVGDPIKWITTYKIGNPWRKPNENADYSSNFATGSATGEQGTKIWLMGDGTNDSSSNIASQVNGSSSDQYLQLNSASTTSVSIPGL